MAKKRGFFHIPSDPSDGPSLVAIIILFIIPEFVTKIIGGVLLAKRIRNEALRRRYQMYRRLASAIGDRNEVSIRGLAATLDMPTGNLVSELQSMIDQGMIGGNAYIDRSHLTLHIDASDTTVADLGEAVSQVINVFVNPEERARTVAAARATQAARAKAARQSAETKNDDKKAEDKGE